MQLFLLGLIYTNNLLAMIVNYDIENILEIWSFIITQIRKIKLSKELKILLYSQLIKDTINTLNEEKENSINKIKNNINIIINLIKNI